MDMNPSPIFNACVSPQHMNVVTVFQVVCFKEDFDNGSNRSPIRIGFTFTTPAMEFVEFRYVIHLFWFGMV